MKITKNKAKDIFIGQNYEQQPNGSENNTCIEDTRNITSIYKGKVGICGLGVTGKSCLFEAISSGKFNEKTLATVAANYNRKIIHTDSGNVELIFYVITGQESFNYCICTLCLKDADSIVIVTCVDNENWHDKVSDMIKIIKKVNQNAKLYLAVTKSDIEITIDLKEVVEFAEKNNCFMFLVSAKDQNSVDSMTLKIAIDIIDCGKKKSIIHNNDDNININNECVCNIF